MKGSQLEQRKNEARIFGRFMAGHDAAFNRLFAMYNQKLFTFCLKITGSTPIAEDVVQETWMRVISMRSKTYREKILNPGGFIIRIARNLCLDHLRSQKKFQDIDPTDEKTTLRYEMREMSEEEEIVQRCLKQLPYSYQETLILHTYCGYSYEDIAQILGKSSDAIWARASRARKKLREHVVKEIERERGRLTVLTRKSRNHRTG